MTESAEWLVACDLDQTLIYSRRAFRLPAGAAEPPVVTVEYLDGEPLSFMTAAARKQLGRLAERVPVVPVTTRTHAQYSRVRLGFEPRYAIAANGGHLLVDGVPDPEWTAVVRRRLADSAAALEELRPLAAVAAAMGSGQWVRVVRDADGFFLYLVATGREAIPDLRAVEEALTERGWTMSIQGRKVYFVPRALTKEAALARVLDWTGAAHLAAAGDSLLDAGMLAAADAAVRPAHGELQDAAGAPSTHALVTPRSGLLGGEDVVALLADITAERSQSPATGGCIPVTQL